MKMQAEHVFSFFGYFRDGGFSVAHSLNARSGGQFLYAPTELQGAFRISILDQ